MSLTPEEDAELLRLEDEFEAAGGRGVELADRLDFLRTKSQYPTVSEIIADLQNLPNPDTTFVVLDSSEVDYPMEFVAMADMLGHL
jgi:hypothetical protein